jgi:N-acetylglucosaminyldiphosphoundecaprenol N-acetyl-beta-D-mannosaminyltransferase
MNMDSRVLLGVRIHSTSYHEASSRILEWAVEGRSSYVCAANVHMLMEARDSTDFSRVVNEADLVTPDGMPLVWALRSLGIPGQERVYGPDLMLRVCERAAQQQVPVGLYGGFPERMTAMKDRLQVAFPGLVIAYSATPAFRPLSLVEDEEILERINDSGAKILFVGLGCPTQERWMAARRGKVQAVMLGVGAAFDFLSGRVRQAPSWIQGMGFEWLFRLAADPRRLFLRYARHNPRFLVLAGLELARARITERWAPPGER